MATNWIFHGMDSQILVLWNLALSLLRFWTEMCQQQIRAALESRDLNSKFERDKPLLDGSGMYSGWPGL